MKRNKNDIRIIIENGHTLLMNRDVYDYITQLKNRLDAIETELQTIKPVLAVGGLKPAVSRLCKDCRFVVTSRYNGDILGCNKECVCEDYYPKEGKS